MVSSNFWSYFLCFRFITRNLASSFFVMKRGFDQFTTTIYKEGIKIGFRWNVTLDCDEKFVRVFINYPLYFMRNSEENVLILWGVPIFDANCRGLIVYSIILFGAKHFVDKDFLSFDDSRTITSAYYYVVHTIIQGRYQVKKETHSSSIKHPSRKFGSDVWRTIGIPIDKWLQTSPKISSCRSLYTSSMVVKLSPYEKYFVRGHILKKLK